MPSPKINNNQVRDNANISLLPWEIPSRRGEGGGVGKGGPSWSPAVPLKDVDPNADEQMKIRSSVGAD